MGLNIVNDIEYRGPGVYALIDPNGKAYIGSSKNVRSRIQAHRINAEFQENIKLQQCMKDGTPFYAILLESLDSTADKYDLDFKEGQWLSLYGDIHNTYNQMKISNLLPPELLRNLRPYANQAGNPVIVNLHSGRMFICNTRDISTTIKSHFRLLIQNKHYNHHMQKDFNQGDPFGFMILDNLYNYKQLIADIGVFAYNQTDINCGP